MNFFKKNTNNTKTVAEMTDYVGAFKLDIRFDPYVASRLNLWLNSDHCERPDSEDLINTTVFGRPGANGELKMPNYKDAFFATLEHGFSPIAAPHLISAYEDKHEGKLAGKVPSMNGGVIIVDDAKNDCSWICCTGKASDNAFAWLNILCTTILPVLISGAKGVIWQKGTNLYAVADGRRSIVFTEDEQGSAPTYVKEVKQAIIAAETAAALTAKDITENDFLRFCNDWKPTPWCLGYEFAKMS